MKTTIFYDVQSTGVSRDADIISIGLVAVTEIPHMVDVSILSNYGETYEQQIKNYLKINPTQKEIKAFYAEFDDFNVDKCDDWVKENIVGKLMLKNYIDSTEMALNNEIGNVIYKGDTDIISFYLKEWLCRFESVEFYADYDVIDKPMLIDLIADWNTKLNEEEDFGSYKIGLPKHLPNINYYDFYDIHSILKWKGIDPDINREEFINIENQRLLSGKYPETMDDLQKHNAIYDAWICWKMYEKLKSM